MTLLGVPGGSCNNTDMLVILHSVTNMIFDTVDHNILLQKLYHYGVQELDLKLFESYLSNRKQFTRIDGVDSSIQNINIGVPQGSCLGPLPCLIYINGLPYSVKNAKLSMYADDICLALQSDQISQLTEVLNDDL